MLEKRKSNGDLLKSDYTKLAAIKRDREMEVAEQEYKKYIHRRAFKQLRERCLERDGYRCRCCGRTAEELKKHNQYLQAHHMSYQHLGENGDEELNDLIILDTYCHKAIHSSMANKGRFRDKRPILEYLKIDIGIGVGDTVICNENGYQGIVLECDKKGCVVNFNHGEEETWLEYTCLDKVD